MKTWTLIPVCLCLLIIQLSHAQSDTIFNRYRQYLLQSAEMESETKAIISSLNSDGRWADLNYGDTEPANWKLLIHLKRVKDLALAYSRPQSGYYQSEEVKRSFDAALNHWLKVRYKSSNWWHNEIGVPQQIRDVIILMKGELSSAQLASALEVLAQYHVYDNTVGANLTWSADLGFHYALLTNDSALMKKCRDLLLKEIKITTGEGVQPDYSFHQHGSRLQMYQYGKAFLWENVRIAWQLRGTPLAFPPEQINILTDFALKGWQWMARGIHTVPGTMDRSASRKNAMDGADMRALLPYFMELTPSRKAAMAVLLENQNGQGSLHGFRYFPYSDFTAYQTGNFSFFLKTISDRTLATESINNENLKGHLLNSGDAYLVRDGNEYYNVMPVWDWDNLPGVTSFRGADRIRRMSFAGSVSDDANGFSSMDYCLQDKTGQKSVSAKKSWFCTDGKVLCLVAGLKGNNVDSAYTALDQCRWRDKVFVNNRKVSLGEGNHVFNDAKWIYHAGFAYMPIGQGRVTVRLQTINGNWSDINRSESGEVSERMFTPIVTHSRIKEGQSFAYMLATASDGKMAQRTYKHPGWRIIRNDTICQAALSGKQVMAAFFQPAEIRYGKSSLTVDRPCLLMIKGQQVIASDPIHKGGRLKLRLNNKDYEMQLDKDGASTVRSLSELVSQIDASLPGELRVVSYNIHHANPPSKAGLIDVSAIANVIRQQQADIVALQEVDVNTTRSGVSLNEAGEIARLTGMHAFFAKSIDYAGGQYGVAILSKFPMEDEKNTPLPTDESTSGEHRTLASATIILPGDRKIVFACTHLDAQHNDVNRQLQIKKILEVLAPVTLPVIIAGDFNALPNSDVISQLDSHFTRSCTGDCPFTIPENEPNRTIDYIAFTPAEKFTVVSHEVIDEKYASDHRPVKAVLQIK